MTFEPREKDTIYESLRSNLINRVAGLTNFTETSFNYVWAQAFSEEFRDTELHNFGAYLSGFIDYSGGPVTEDDLRTLGVNDVTTPEEVNQYLEDDNLDELVKLVDVDRDEGSGAAGTVTFTTASATTTIPEGTSVGTQPDARGEFLEFETTAEVSTGSGVTSVDVDIEAVDVGTDYNIGSGTITYLPDPPANVQAVTNSEATTGGVDRESNDDLRERAKRAIFQSSGGGTVEGIIGYINENVDDVSEVNVDELFTGDSWHGNHPHGHVIVNGGDREEILDAINESRPVSVEHLLVRPSVHTIRIDADVDGENISASAVQTRVSDYFGDLGLGDDLIRAKVIQAILNADEDIDNIPVLDFSVEEEGIPVDESTIDDFEDDDLNVINRFWGDWAGDTGSFSTTSSTTIDGSFSGSSTAANANVAISTTRTTTTTRSFEMTVQMQDQSANGSDAFSITPISGGTSLGSIEFRGNGDVAWVESGDTTITTWNTGTDYTVTLQFDFDNDQVDVSVGGSNENDLALLNSVSDWDELELRNDTTNSTSSVTVVFDELYSIEDTYSLGLGEEMVDDGITEVRTISGGSFVTLAEDIDYREVDVSGDATDDSIQLILDGTQPDLTSGETRSRQFRSGTTDYYIDNRMVTEGVSAVENANGTTYTEGTDWEEVDTTDTGSDDGITWLDGGQSPDDGQDFTVTYERSVELQIDYDIVDEDTTIDNSEQASDGTISVTIL